MTITLTATTCADNCWYAREDACSCSCGGANHGIMKSGVNRAEPTRTRRVRRTRYELRAVVDGWFEARCIQHNARIIYNTGEPIITQRATAGQTKWFVVQQAGVDKPYLVWQAQNSQECEACGSSQVG